MPTSTPRGPILRPGDSGYAAELAGFQTAYTHRPALIVAARETGDVVAAVRYAAARGLPVAVQATGHGLSVPTDGVLISTRALTDVRVDPDAATARVAAGVRAGALIEAAAPHGLAPLTGSAPSVGVVGYHLGGGLGLLARTFGYAADRVRGIEMVTADGELRALTPEDELFGAVLGTGGNFGVVTALDLDLPLVPEVFGGQLVFDTPHVERAVRIWREWTATVPDTLTSTLTMPAYPDLPQVARSLRGRFVASIRVAFFGPTAEGERWSAGLRGIGPRLVDDLRTMPYTESHTIHRDPDRPHAYAATNALLREFTAETAAALLDLAGPGGPVRAVLDIRHLGGALRRARGITAVDHRDAAFLVRVITAPDADDPTAAPPEHTRVRAALAPWTLGHSPNFLYGAGAAADEAQTRAGYSPGTYARLAVLKGRYDPRNLFRANRNIRPASGAEVVADS
ncbi:FAD-binding oxidoreductase [Nocardia takedensis]|uniref:FAD-binding oxidoreductase n=1 Tax=Nocardia takedensis TaxID=259390 RepID=UPI00031665B6|nr:FAD-binding oxidoreductase [Nocardia takedensis]